MNWIRLYHLPSIGFFTNQLQLLSDLWPSALCFSVPVLLFHHWRSRCRCRCRSVLVFWWWGWSLQFPEHQTSLMCAPCNAGFAFWDHLLLLVAGEHIWDQDRYESTSLWDSSQEEYPSTGRAPRRTLPPYTLPPPQPGHAGNLWGHTNRNQG